MNVIDREIRASDPRSLQCYLQGALRDGTASARHGTHRFGQSDTEWLECLRLILTTLGHRSWMYREGRARRFWILETAASFLDVSFDASVLAGKPEARAFARGYFDADGGMPLARDARLYLQFTQKNKTDLDRLRGLLEADGIACGRIHNPSRRVDPEYWRFFIRAHSQASFMVGVGSWHPRKRPLVEDRLLRRRSLVSRLRPRHSPSFLQMSDSAGMEQPALEQPSTGMHSQSGQLEEDA